jgi:hypothetical protein
LQLTPASRASLGLVASGIQPRGFGVASQRWLVQLKPDPLCGGGRRSRLCEERMRWVKRSTVIFPSVR